MRTVSFVVPGVPTAKARTRDVPLKECMRCHRKTARRVCWCGSEDLKFITNLEITPEKTKQYESYVRLFAKQALGDEHMLSGPLRFSAVCWFQIPKSRAKKLQEGQPHTQKPDWDNLAKSISDGLNAVLYGDDCTVYTGSVTKYWTHGSPRAEVVVEERDEAELGNAGS